MTTPRDTTRNYFQAPKASKPKKKTIRRMSAKKARDLKEYTRLRAEFMAERPVCHVWLQENGWTQCRNDEGKCVDEFFKKVSNDRLIYAPSSHLFAIGAPRSEECHHAWGRGKYYLVTSTWMAVSAANHKRIHNRPGQARAAGWLK